MSSVLERLRSARPDVAPPSDESRRAGLERLLAAIEDEPPGLHALQARRGAGPHHRSNGTAHRPRPQLPPAARRPGRRAGLGRALRPLVSALVVAITAAVVVVALVVPGHRHTASGGGASGQGRIEARGGESLTTGTAALPAVIAAGLRRHYGAELADGRTLRTTIDGSLQRTGMRSLLHSITVNRGSGGTFLALDPRTGAVEAIGTAGPRRGAARVDGAVSATGSPGGAFFAFTALAALEAGVWSPGETYDDTGRFCVGVCLENPGHAAYGPITLASALAVEDHTPIDELGARLDTGSSGDGALQQTARRLGFGARTGIDLPDEASGVVPGPGGSHDGGWRVIDNVDLAGGRGGLEVTPVQLAVAYAAIANGGTIVTPHLAAGFSGGGPATPLRRWPSRRVALSAGALGVVREGLEANAGRLHGRPRAGGATDDVLGSLRVPVAGAVGSVQLVRGGHEHTDAWYGGYVQEHGRSLVVVVSLAGGYGDVAAAPVARQLFSQWATGRPGRWVHGVSTAG